MFFLLLDLSLDDSMFKITFPATVWHMRLLTRTGTRRTYMALNKKIKSIKNIISYCC